MKCINCKTEIKSGELCNYCTEGEEKLATLKKLAQVGRPEGEECYHVFRIIDKIRYKKCIYCGYVKRDENI